MRSAQTTLLAAAGGTLPLLFRVRHPRTQLAYGHAVLAACLLLPLLQPWQHGVAIQEPRSEEPAVLTGSATPTPAPADASSRIALQTAAPRTLAPVAPTLWTQWVNAQNLVWILVAGALARLGWLLVGLWQIRRYRIAATPLYPIPESVRAASAITHADAVLCISPEINGPVMLGWLAPVVLLPECFLSLEGPSAPLPATKCFMCGAPIGRSRCWKNWRAPCSGSTPPSGCSCHRRAWHGNNWWMPRPCA